MSDPICQKKDKYLLLNHSHLQLDDGRFIPGFEAAVKSMEKDEEAEFLIAPEVRFNDLFVK